VATLGLIGQVASRLGAVLELSGNSYYGIGSRARPILVISSSISAEGGFDSRLLYKYSKNQHKVMKGVIAFNTEDV